MLKRILSCLTAISMLAANVSVFADETTNESADNPNTEFVNEEVGNNEAENEEVQDDNVYEEIAGGVCGESAVWILDSGGTLTISGAGDMQDYSSSSSGDMSPWYSYKDSITSVVIKDGVTHIGNSAFFYCSNLAQIAIPESVKSIGSYAFSSCSGLTNVSIPEGVKSIGRYAFDYCSYLSELTLSVGVTDIGSYAFNNCSRLKEITIPESVTSIGNSAFNNCDSLTQINADSNNAHYAAADGVLFDKNMSTLIRCPEGKEGTYTVPENVESISEAAFYGCKGLLGITVPATVREIGIKAFTCCSALTEINVNSDNVYYTSMCGILYNKNMDTLICCPAGNNGVVIVPDSVKNIEECAFAYCDDLTGVIIPDGVELINRSTFVGCERLENVVIPNGVTSIGKNAFGKCKRLSNIVIPKSVTDIESSVFNDCKRLQNVYYNGTYDEWKSIRIENTGNDYLQRKDDIHYINDYGICGDNLMWVFDNDNTLTINGTGDMRDYNLTDDDMTPWCLHKDDITAVEINGAASIGGGAFKNCRGPENIVLPNEVASIGDDAFAGCSGLVGVTIKNSEAFIGENVFTDCAPEFTIKGYKGSTAQTYAAENGIMFEELPPIGWENGVSGVSGSVIWNLKGDTLYLCGSEMYDYDVGEAPWYAGRTMIKNIVLDDGISNVGTYAFYGLKNLVSVTWSDGVTSIGENAFEGCTSLVGTEFPAELKSIGNHAFIGCTSLESVTVPDDAILMGASVFEGCTALAEITLPFIGAQVGSRDSKTVFSYIFGDNVPESLKKVTITGETNVPENAFKDCANIENISINSEVKTIGASAFDGCKKLKAFVIPDGIKIIGNRMFCGCESAVSIKVPDTVAAIGASAFDGCASLTAINIPNKVKSIENYTFRNCTSLTQIDIPTSVKNIGDGALEGCIRLYEVKIPFVGANTAPGSGVTNEGIFGYLFGVTDNREVPYAVTKVEVTGTDRNLYIPESAFKDCIYIADIIIDGGRAVSDRAFENCKSLKNLYIPKSIHNIGEEILLDCVNLETLTVPFIGNSHNDKNTETSVLGGFFGYDDTDMIKGTKQYYKYGQQDSHYYKIPQTLKNVSVLNQPVIPTGAFMECDFIERVSIVSGAEMGEQAFYNCVSLKTITLPNDMQTMKTQAFANCESLENINIPANVKSIGEQVFYNARSLKNVTIPDSVTEIADDVFNGTNLYTMSEIGLMSDSLTITCSKDSAAREYAEARGIATNIVPSSELNVRKTATTVSLLSDNSYLFDVMNAYAMRGILHVELYDKNGRMTCEKTQDTGADVEYRVEFSQEEMSGVSSAKMYIADDDGKMISTAAETASLADGEIPMLPENDIEIVYDSDSGSVSFTGTAAVYMKTGAVLIAAVYNNSDGSLYEVKLYDVADIDDAKNIDTAFDDKTVKLMLWKSMKNAKPLADTVE